MNHLIMGNIFSLLGMGADMVSASQKSAKGVLWMQTLGQVLYTVSCVFLKGYSAVVQHAVSVVRNLAAIRGVQSKVVEWSLVGIAFVLGVVFNNLGVIGWLPVIANLEYSVAVFRFKENGTALKKALLLTLALYAAFNLSIQNYVGVLSNGAVFMSALVFLIKDRKKVQESKR